LNQKKILQEKIEKWAGEAINQVIYNLFLIIYPPKKKCIVARWTTQWNKKEKRKKKEIKKRTLKTI
jgi:hypothetical protein